MGPLTGVKVVELAALGPAPFAGTLLSDMGAEVVRVERASIVDAVHQPTGFIVDARGRRTVGIDLKHPEGRECLLRLVEQADVLIEGYRPGVMERLGLGPDDCLARNPRLVYGRMTGWGQEGPLARAAGHDINYIALAGSLAHIGRAGEAPVPPMNLVGDYGGGGMFLAFGVVSALLEATHSGLGQVVDAAMVDGTAFLMGHAWGMREQGTFTEVRGTNRLDTGAPYYDVYETADGRWVSIGTIEPQFFAELFDRLAIDPEPFLPHDNRAHWPALRERLTAVFKTKTRDEWCEVLEGSDACFAPVLPMSDAIKHPHLEARGTLIEYEGVEQPAPAPRFSRTPGAIQSPHRMPGTDTNAVLAAWGFAADEIAALASAGAIKQATAVSSPD